MRKAKKGNVQKTQKGHKRQNLQIRHKRQKNAKQKKENIG